MICRSTWTSFAQPAIDQETLQKQSFFLRYHGHGLTLQDVNSMTFDTMQREVKMLHEQLQAEAKAREEAQARARARRK